MGNAIATAICLDQFPAESSSPTTVPTRGRPAAAGISQGVAPYLDARIGYQLPPAARGPLPPGCRHRRCWSIQVARARIERASSGL